MGNKYGKTALSASFSLPNFDSFLKKIQDAGNNIDAVCKDAVDAALPIVEESMRTGAARHRKGTGKYGTDTVYNAIETKPAVADKWGVWGEAGIDTNKHPEAKHAVYQEYGDGHSPEFPDPFIRPAVDDNRAAIAKIEREVLRKGGIQIE